MNFHFPLSRKRRRLTRENFENFFHLALFTRVESFPVVCGTHRIYTPRRYCSRESSFVVGRNVVGWKTFRGISLEFSNAFGRRLKTSRREMEEGYYLEQRRRELCVYVCGILVKVYGIDRTWNCRCSELRACLRKNIGDLKGETARPLGV